MHPRSCAGGWEAGSQGKPPLPAQTLFAISPVAFAKEKKCRVLQGPKHSALPSPAHWGMSVPKGRGPVAPASRPRGQSSGVQGGREIKHPPPTLLDCMYQSCLLSQFLRLCVGFPAFLLTTKYYVSLPLKTQ